MVKIIKDFSETNEPVAAAYERVTVEESFKKNLSIPAQIKENEECAERFGWTHLKHYTEPMHCKASSWNRKTLQELIKDIKAGRVKKVLIRDEDRLWRDVALQQELLTIFAEHRVELWAHRGNLDYRTPHGKLVLNITGATAQYEKEITGERIRKIKRVKAMEGKPGGGPPPYGYTSQSRLMGELLRQGLPKEEAYRKACEIIPVGKQFIIDQKEAAVVRLIFELYVDKRAGCRKIANYLNELGYRRRSGLLWHPDKVRRIINDPVVAGYMVYDEEAYQNHERPQKPKFSQNLFKGQHEPIIRPEIWQRAQEIKADHRTLTPAGRARRAISFPLRNILICGKCQKPMKSRTAGVHHSYGYYICIDRKYFGPTRCDFPLLNSELVEKTVWEYLEGLLQSPRHILAYVEKVNQKILGATSAPPAAVEHMQTRLKNIESNLRKWYTYFESAKDPIEEGIAWNRIKELQTQKEQVEKELEALRPAMRVTEPKEITGEATQKYLAGLHQHMKAHPERQAELYRLLRRRHNFSVKALSRYEIMPVLQFTPDGLPMAMASAAGSSEDSWAWKSQVGQDDARATDPYGTPTDEL